MITVVSYKWGERYDPRYWNILKKSVERNLSVHHRFIVICDNTNGLSPDIETIKMNMKEDLFAMWTKMTIFRPKPFGITGRILLLDADTVITGNLDDLVDLEGDLYLYPDWWHSAYAFAVTMMDEGCRPILWETFLNNVKGNIMRFGRDEFFIKKLCPNEKFFPKPWVRSYKAHSSTYKERKGELPMGCKFLCFHGKPDPHQILGNTVNGYGPDPWIAHYWKQ